MPSSSPSPNFPNGSGWRNDDIVKPELFREAERDGYRIVQAFEDRSRVVDALRAAGYAVAQVAEGRF